MTVRFYAFGVRIPALEKKKARHHKGNGLCISNGAPSGIRTRDIHLERVASLAARRWGQREKSIADFFVSSYIDDKLENHHKGACPLCGGGVLGKELHGGVVGGVLVGVVEGLERQQGCGLRITAALEGVRDQPVGELGVLG